MEEIAISRLELLGKLSDKEDDLSTLDFSNENVDFIYHNVLGNFTKGYYINMQNKTINQHRTV